MLPEFADETGLAATAGFWAGLGLGTAISGRCGRHHAATAARGLVGEQGGIERTAMQDELSGEPGSLRGLGRGGIGHQAMPQRIELGVADFQAWEGGADVATARIEVGEHGGQAVAELLFINAADTVCHPAESSANLRERNFASAFVARSSGTRADIHTSSHDLSGFTPTPARDSVRATVFAPHHQAPLCAITGNSEPRSFVQSLTIPGRRERGYVDADPDAHKDESRDC